MSVRLDISVCQAVVTVMTHTALEQAGKYCSRVVAVSVSAVLTTYAPTCNTCVRTVIICTATQFTLPLHYLSNILVHCSVTCDMYGILAVFLV